MGNLCKLRGREQKTYGRELPLARFPEEKGQGKLILLKSIQRRIRAYFKDSKSKGRPPPRMLTLEQLEKRLLPLLPKITLGGQVLDMVEKNGLVSVKLDYSKALVVAWRD